MTSFSFTERLPCLSLQCLPMQSCLFIGATHFLWFYSGQAGPAAVALWRIMKLSARNSKCFNELKIQWDES